MNDPVSLAALMAPKLCDLRPCADRGPKKIRLCLICGRLSKPYKCRVDALRLASQPADQTRQGEP